MSARCACCGASARCWRPAVPLAPAFGAHLTASACSVHLAPPRARPPSPLGAQECIGPLCYDFSRLDDYLAQPAVRAALGVGDRAWQSCSADVYQDMSSAPRQGLGFRVLGACPDATCRMGGSPETWACAGDIMMNYAPYVQRNLEAGMRVMIYLGTGAVPHAPGGAVQNIASSSAAPGPACALTKAVHAGMAEDWICNYMGNWKWLSEMPWSGQAEFLAAPERNWTVGGAAAGSVQAHGPLSFVKVFNAVRDLLVQNNFGLCPSPAGVVRRAGQPVCAGIAGSHGAA